MDLTERADDRYDAACRALVAAWPVEMGEDRVFAEQVARVAVEAASEFEQRLLREAFDRAVATSRPVVLSEGTRMSVRVERRLPWWRRLFDRRRWDDWGTYAVEPWPDAIDLGRSAGSDESNPQGGGE